jgi:hypothetical protein
MAAVAEAYEAQTTITKAMLPLLKNLVLFRGVELMRYRVAGNASGTADKCHSNTGPPAADSDFSHV